MFGKYSEKFKKIGRTIESIRKDAHNGVIKDTSTISSSVIFGPADFQSDLAMIKFKPLDPFSEKPEDIERRDNLLAYYSAIMNAFDGRDFEQKSYIKRNK